MLIPAFSTVACPDWTLKQVAERAIGLGFEAVELRTFGDGSRRFACDPALSSEAKVHAQFREAGVDIVCLATGVRFDGVVWPPVAGYLSPDLERSVREGKRAVDLAAGLECPFVRVFGFEYPARETKAEAFKRIVGRLRQVVDHADKSGIRVVVENGGSFASAAALLELVRAVDHPVLGACYAFGAGAIAGDSGPGAIDLLGDSLAVARIKDVDQAGRPTMLGRGRLGVEAFVRALAARGFGGPLVYEWDRAWIPDLGAPEAALTAGAKAMYGWLGAPMTGERAGASKPGAAAGR